MPACSRRVFLLGSASTFAGVYLAACGKEPSAEVAAAEIPVGSAIIIDRVIFAQPEPGTYKAYSQTCPHQGSLITKVEGSVATCTSHFTSYDLSSGAVIAGPGTKPLREFAVSSDGTTVSNAPS